MFSCIRFRKRQQGCKPKIGGESSVTNKHSSESSKRRNINCRRNGNWRKRKGSKENDYGKSRTETRCLIEGHPCLVAFVYESDNNVVSQRLVEKVQLPISFHPNQARIKFSTGQYVKEVLCDIAPTNSCHLLFRWARLHFETLNLD